MPRAGLSWCPARRARRRSAVRLNTGNDDGIHSAMAAPPGAPATQPAMFGRLQEYYLPGAGYETNRYPYLGATTYSMRHDLLAPEDPMKLPTPGRTHGRIQDALRTENACNRRTLSLPSPSTLLRLGAWLRSADSRLP